MTITKIVFLDQQTLTSVGAKILGELVGPWVGETVADVMAQASATAESQGGDELVYTNVWRDGDVLFAS